MQHRHRIRLLIAPLIAILGLLTACGGNTQHPAMPAVVDPSSKVSYAQPLPHLSESVVRKQLACSVEDGWFWSGSSADATKQPTGCP